MTQSRPSGACKLSELEKSKGPRGFRGPFLLTSNGLLKLMQLEQMTWQEVDAYLKHSDCIVLPTGSTEQHGPMGLIGTDTLCAGAIATAAADIAKVIVAPALAYTPAPFNTAFPGTVSLSAGLFKDVVSEILDGFIAQGFQHIFILNGHGANLEPLGQIISTLPAGTVRLKSWWDYEAVQILRKKFYGDWEGMHATPSEVAITQALHRVVPAGDAQSPPTKLSTEYIAAHSGDRHGPPEDHRANFPDGRVGSHSALATPEQGNNIFDTAISAVAEDIFNFLTAEL